MAEYRAADAVNAPSLISWARLPLAATFPFVVEQPQAALAVLMAAGTSDVVDGWLARKTGRVTPLGAALDPITDKLFVLTVIATLIAKHRLPRSSLLLLSTREIAEAPLVAWYALRRHMRAAAETPMSNWSGKAATTLQFATVALALVRSKLAKPLLYATATAGVVAAASYIARALNRAETSALDRAASATNVGR